MKFFLIYPNNRKKMFLRGLILQYCNYSWFKCEKIYVLECDFSLKKDSLEQTIFFLSFKNKNRERTKREGSFSISSKHIERVPAWTQSQIPSS